jgi:threonine dehydrogenase-like Zn-dependent dehydrogenase
MPVPKPADDQVLVRVTTTQVSAGTEMQIYGVRTRRAGTNPNTRPGPLGYTAVGVVEAVGRDVEGWSIGERVICHGAHASHHLVRPSATDGLVASVTEYWLQRVPDGLTDVQACFGVLGDVALHALRRAAIQPGESLAVHGLGVVGNIAVQLASRWGAYPVIGIDVIAARLDLATRLGASHAVNAADDDTVAAIRAATTLPPEHRWRGADRTREPDAGADVQLHCNSELSILPAVLRAAAFGGRVVLVGTTDYQTVSIDTDDLFRREVALLGSHGSGRLVAHRYYPWSRRRDRELIWDLILRGALDVDQLVSHVVPATEAPGLYETMAQSSAGWLAVHYTWT